MKNDLVKKELADSREELQKASEELRKLKDLTDEEINSLTAERDDSNEEKLAFQLEYEGNKEKLSWVREQLSKIQDEYKQLAEHRDEITDQLVIERDNASDERYRARICCEEIKTQILVIEGKIAETRTQCTQLKDDTNNRSNGLAAERDRHKDDIHRFNSEYEETTKMLKQLKTKIPGVETSTFKHANGTTKDVSNQKPLKTNNDSGIEIDFDVMTQEIKDQVDIFVDKKLNNLGMKTSMEIHTMHKNDDGGQIFEIRGNINNTRERNIVIHGCDETNEGDQASIKKLFSIMEMDTGPTIVHRLGAKKKDGVRPIRIVMESESQKTKFMSNLWKLKYADSAIKKIRVTDDYTWEERQEIRRWVTMAEERNKREEEGKNGNTNYKWKVRGTPKYGMRIVQIRI